ncbi:OCIA domain-containing protein 1 isoform X1 [Mauremys reevesii]|uniref:OCIA domain-containing protein 1 isoform X1 n=2 Tax=Mauremys reevesii TaxID=260615 RepID=UPI0019401964|nr:OCIA domain-containing protein 1 isoform X1 [Mauremys reevesii]XP_039396577.1 OCIA domain-containing protein 1 isoform X1 [Mauremys reevesii]
MDPPGQVGRGPRGEEHGGPGQNPVGMAYVPTEDERRIFRECNEESFWYRSVPISAISMIVTQGLIKKGILTTHSRFGSLPKVAFAGICGYIAGKISYMSACQEKFKRLENSPIGESIRQGHRPLPHEYAAQKSEFANLPSQSPFGSSPTAEVPLSSSYSHEYSSADRSVSNYAPIPFSSSLNESSPTGITEHNAPESVPLLEESPKRKSVSYEELRNRNRETYEGALTQKAETPVKSSQERPFKKEVKVNKYGDAWEE